MATVELRYDPKDTAWFTANATMILKAGEPAYHSTTGQFKLGDGTTQLSALSFLPASSGGGGGNFVPYTGATGDVDLGEYEIKVGQIELDQTPTGTASVAVTRWNDTNGTTETTLKGGSVVIKNGIDLVVRVVNKVTPSTTLTKAAYQVVKISGAQGQRLAVGLAQGNNDNNSADTLGLAIETILPNEEGFIMAVGQLENINTTGSLQGETWADGDVLYLSPTTPGAITKVKPNGSTGHIVVLGYVEYAHANNGKIYVKVMNGWELDELHNVYINNPADNEILTYENSTSLWKNKTVVTALGYTPYNNTNPSGFISSSALTPYLTSSNAALTYVPYTGATGAVDLSTNNLTCGDAIIKKPKITVELVDSQTVNFYNRYNLTIDSITNVLNSPTITIQDDNVAYTLGNTIASGSKITITASTASVVVLNATRL
jgi:nitrogen fixation protein